MVGTEKKKLIAQATKLYTLGKEVEKCRKRLKKLVEKRVPYESPQMRTALMEFMTVDNEWKRLEQEHLIYRSSLIGSEEIA